MLDSVKPHQSQLRNILLIHAILLAFLISWGLFDLGEGFMIEDQIKPACLILLGLLVWCIWSWQFITKSWFNPYVLFILSAYLFNGGDALLDALNFKEKGVLAMYGFDSETIFNSIYYTILAFVIFHFGGLLSHIKSNKTLETAYIYQTIKDKYMTSIYLEKVGYFMLILAIIPAIYVFYNGVTIFLQGSYVDLYTKGTSVGIAAVPRLLTFYLVPSSFMLLSVSKDKMNVRILSLIIIGGYALINLFMGTRGQALLPVVTYLWLWHRVIRPVPGIILVTAGLFSLAFLFPLVAIFRNLPTQDRFSTGLLAYNFSAIDSPLALSISTMGQTMRTIAYCLDLVPNTRPFEWGSTYLYAIFTLFPNFFWDIHPSQVHSLSDWLTYTVAPDFFNSGGGYGFTFIAEAYINFDWYGGLLALCTMGYFYAKLVSWAENSGDLARIAAVACALPFILFYARAESANLIRPLFMYCFIPYFVVQRLKIKAG